MKGLTRSKAIKYFVVTVISIIGLWLILSYGLLSVSTGMIFKQERSIHVYPIHEVYSQEFFSLNNGTKIDALYYNNPEPKADKVILYLHGNSGRIPHFFNSFENGYDYYSPAYPGFHFSEGAPTSQNAFETGEKAYQQLLDKGYTDSQIIIYGHSLGGPVATHVAAIHPNAKALILVNPVSSVQRMCTRSYSIFCVFGGSIMNGVDEAKKINPHTPVFVYHEKNDTVVPFDEGKFLYDSIASDNKSFIELDGQTHSYFDIDKTLESVR